MLQHLVSLLRDWELALELKDSGQLRGLLPVMETLAPSPVELGWCVDLVGCLFFAGMYCCSCRSSVLSIFADSNSRVAKAMLKRGQRPRFDILKTKWQRNFGLLPQNVRMLADDRSVLDCMSSHISFSYISLLSWYLLLQDTCYVVYWPSFASRSCKEIASESRTPRACVG
jgi:hypothetical protein